jgi:hyperosmotically inducible protein
MSFIKKLLVMVSMVVISSAVMVNYANAAETSKQYVKSSAITADVKAKLLADSDVKSLHISVKTVHDKVILTGHVDTAAQKDKAGSIAAACDGVASVDNKLKVKAPKKSST